MKEKITLFIALSFLVGLTMYKKTIDTDIELASNMLIKTEQPSIESVISDSVADTNQENNSSGCDSKEIDTNTLQFSEAFNYYRNCNHDSFVWNGLEYTTTLKSEINDNLDKEHESLNNKMDLVSK